VSFAESLPQTDRALWTRATKHPFFEAIGDGTLPIEAFNVSISQHYHLIIGLGAYTRTLAAIAPDADRSGLRVVASMLEPEYDLFRRYAQREQINLEAEPIRQCSEYLAFLNASVRADYGHGLVAYYACERSLFEAWTFARALSGFSSPYAEWLENWSSSEFERFVQWIGRCVDAAVGDGCDELREVFVGTVRHAIAFWDSFVP